MLQPQNNSISDSHKDCMVEDIVRGTVLKGAGYGTQPQNLEQFDLKVGTSI